MTVGQVQGLDPTMGPARNTGGGCDIRVSDLGRLQFRDGILVQIEPGRNSGAATPEGVKAGDLLGYAAGRYDNPAVTSEGIVAAATDSTSGSSYLFDNPAVTPDDLAKNDFGMLRIDFIAVRRDGFCNYN